MKKWIFLIVAFLLLNCDHKKLTIALSEHLFCDVTDPKNELLWLKSIIDLAETDRTGNYLGKIWAESYLGSDVIFIDMSMGSGGVAGHWFNCDGSKLVVSPNSYPIPTKKKLIYRNTPLK
jgi:hypothetical protein